MMNDFLSIGLGRYRKFGTPYQFVVNNMREVIAAIEKYNGINDCFISISEYQQIGNREFTFPLYFPCDLDATKENQKQVNEDAAKIISWCYAHRISFFLRESGYKGLHIIMPLDISIRWDSFHFKAFLEYLTSTLDLKTIDPVCAEIKRLIRIPNTLNMKSGRFCAPLKTYEAIDLNINRFVNHKTKSFDFDYESTADIVEKNEKIKGNPFLSVHPCIDKLICNDDVDHKIRWMWVKLRQLHGLSKEEIFEEASKMGWSDFDPAKTAYQIQYTMRSQFSIGCKKEYCIDECPFREYARRKKC